MEVVDIEIAMEATVLMEVMEVVDTELMTDTDQEIV